MYRQSKKSLSNSNTCSTCPHNMVNSGPLTAEIYWRVWGTPANFNGFRVLAALLHGTLVVGVSQTMCAEQTAPRIFCRAAITLGIGPYSSCRLYRHTNREVCNEAHAEHDCNANTQRHLVNASRVRGLR